MSDEYKNLADVVLTVVAMVGAGIAFLRALHEYSNGQRWKRAEHLDKLAERFESDELIHVACMAIDWTERRITHEGQSIKLTHEDVLLALRDDKSIDHFPGQQPLIRDAFDVLLAFYGRLEGALSTKLVDIPPAKQQFGYMLERFVRMDKHEDVSAALSQQLGGRDPAVMAATYIEAYGDYDAMACLCGRFGIALAKPAEPRAT